MKHFPLLFAALAFSGAAVAADFRAVSEAAVFYDAPTVRGKKLFVAPKGMPVEVVVSIDNWVKVRDRSGDLMWIEKKSVTDKRTVVVSVASAQLRDKPEDGGRVVLEASQDVSLELVESSSSGWARVKHRDGVVAWVRANQVWGL